VQKEPLPPTGAAKKERKRKENKNIKRKRGKKRIKNKSKEKERKKEPRGICTPLNAVETCWLIELETCHGARWSRRQGGL
jgi:hypothetical protein